MIGNGFTVQVIKYILSFVSKKTTKKKQLELFH